MKSVMMLCGAVIMASALAAQADWPRFMGPKADGISTDKIIKAFPEGKANILWSNDTGEGFGGAAISAGKVYILDRYHGDNKEAFRCFDLITGKEEWKHEYTTAAYKGSYQGSRSTPTVDGDMAYTVGALGDLIAFDLSAKKVAWQKSMGKDFSARAGGWGFAQSPLVHGDLLILSAAGSPNGAIALDKKTGEKKWAAKSFGGSDTYTSALVTKIGGDDHVLVWNKGTLAGLDPATGDVRWSYDWQLRSGRPIPNPVPIGDGRIFLTTGYGQGMRMLEVKKDGNAYNVSEMWSKEAGGSKVSPAVLYKEHVYTISENGGELQCIDLKGNVKWGQKGFSMGGLLIADDTLVVVDGDGGTVHLIEPASGKELSKAPVLKGKDIWAPLAISNSKLVVRDQSTIKCVDLSVK